MSTAATVPPTQGPEIGSEEWMAQKLNALGIQGEESSEESDQEVSSQDGQSEASLGAVEGQIGTGVPAASNWREAVIPETDDTVPQHFRGKRTADVWDSYRNMERAWNEQQQRLRELEAKVAAKETFKEILAEQRAATATPPTPSDDYRAAGIDLETDPVLNPTKFFPKQEQLILDKAKHMLAEELRKRAEEQARIDAAKKEEIAIAAALAHVERERKLSEQQMRARIPSMLMTVGEKFGREALKDPERILAAHDEIFGKPAEPVAIPQTHAAPNPPGVKRPVAVEPSPKSGGPQLKQYEREILSQIGEEITSGLPGVKIDQDRLLARYAANLKRARG